MRLVSSQHTRACNASAAHSTEQCCILVHPIYDAARLDRGVLHVCASHSHVCYKNVVTRKVKDVVRRSNAGVCVHS